MSYIQPSVEPMKPSAPPMNQYQVYPQPQYTYAYPTVQQQQQQQFYYTQFPVQPQRQQMGTGTAMAAGFLAGAVLENMLDPID